MKNYITRDSIPSTILEASKPKVKMGYAKHLLECVSRRTFLEGSAVTGTILNRIADSTMEELNKKGALDSSAFSALVVFDEKINHLLKQLTQQYHTETDPEAKKNLAHIITSSKFLSNPAQDKILKNALNGSKNAQGNRLATFIRLIIQQIIEKKDVNPIEDFKKEITHLREAIEKFYYNEFPFQATIKPYKEYLLGPNSIVEIMDKIADNLVTNEPNITKLNAPIISRSPNTETKPASVKSDGLTDFSDIFGNYQTNYKYESQSAFMEAFAESLEYFSRKN